MFLDGRARREGGLQADRRCSSRPTASGTRVRRAVEVGKGADEEADGHGELSAPNSHGGHHRFPWFDELEQLGSVGGGRGRQPAGVERGRQHRDDTRRADFGHMTRRTKLLVGMQLSHAHARDRKRQEAVDL